MTSTALSPTALDQIVPSTPRFTGLGRSRGAARRVSAPSIDPVTAVPAPAPEPTDTADRRRPRVKRLVVFTGLS
jgi:hypothetical protein